MRHGSLCTGYGGLDIAAQAVFGGELVWWADIEPGPIAVMRRHHPDLSNLGDVRTIDWSAVPKVDILTTGYPCQPFSNAGKRQGLDDPRHIWPYIAAGVGVLRPRVIILENVAGHLRRGFDVVCQDLAALGYDAVWTVVRASDVGAPHRRERLFVIATVPARQRGDGGVESGTGGRSEHPDGNRPATDPMRERLERPGATGPTPSLGRHPADATGAVAADECDYCGCPVIYHDEGGFCAGPCGGNCASERWGRPAQAAANAGLADGVEVQDVDPVRTGLVGDGVRVRRPVAGDQLDAESSQSGADLAFDLLGRDSVEVSGSGDGGEVLRHGGNHLRRRAGSQQPAETSSNVTNWAEYAAAVERWEHVLGRPAPKPTTTGARSARVLSPVFVEWMMGLPAGWVTATEGLSRNQKLRLLGNGVVPQQAEYAIRVLVAMNSVVAA